MPSDWNDAPPTGPGRLVLVVEDDPDTRHFYLSALARYGFRTDQAHNGLQALEKALEVVPDLVVADISVPGIDGIELFRRLRADARTSLVSILAITGYEDRDYLDRAINAGADRVLLKPCSLETLIREVRLLMAQAPP